MSTAANSSSSLRCITIAAIFAGLLAPGRVAFAQYYGKQIVVPAHPDQRLSASLQDLTATLQKMTSQTFTVHHRLTADAIVLALTSEKQTPSSFTQRLKGQGEEAFVIQSHTRDRLWIVANNQLGLSDGIYTYLDKLGCRWYFPNPRWTIIPKRSDITVNLDTVIKPAFLSHDFFGTGGFGPPNPVDPKLTMRRRWSAWRRRNRFAQELPLYGHVGYGFSIRHKKALKAHPSWRAMVRGKRVPYRPGIKFCVSNKQVMSLFVQDRLQALAKRIKRFPNSPMSRYIGVGPSDGGGFCRGPGCMKIGSGSISDQVFHAANVVARAVAKKFPGHGVSLLVYDGFANLPTIKLEPNMHLTIVPYAFQRTGMTGDQLLEAWIRKMKADGLTKFSPPGLYTYWSITDWSKDLPTFDFRHTPAERIAFWHQVGVRALRFESTYSAGAMGPGLYVASHVMWNLHANTRAILKQFFQQCFAGAAAPMRRMLDRWASGFLLTRQELALSFRDLARARELAADHPKVLARIGDYVRYVQYLRRYYEFQMATRDTPAKAHAARALVRLMWRIYPSAMIQTYRLGRLMVYRLARHAKLKNYFNPKDKSAPEWKTVRSPTASELVGWIHKGMADYKPLDYKPHHYAGKLVPLQSAVKPRDQLVPRGRRTFRSMRSVTMHIQARPGVHRFTLQIRVRHFARQSPGDRVVVSGPDGKQIFNRLVKNDNKWHTLHIPMSTPGQYELSIHDSKNGYWCRVTDGIPLAFKGFTPWGISPRLYFYVPKGLSKLAIYDPAFKVRPNFLIDPDGHKISLNGKGRLAVVNIPEGEDGRVWSIQRNSSSRAIRLMNAPDYFSFSPDTVMIPTDAR